jgi:hypothetical protein
MTWYETAPGLGRAGYTYRNDRLRRAEAGAGNFSTDMLFAKIPHFCLPLDWLKPTTLMDRRRKKKEAM